MLRSWSGGVQARAYLITGGSRLCSYEMRSRLLVAWLVLACAPSGKASDVAKRREAAARAVPPAASRFECAGAACRQRHPRLPDTGEWRCAERDAVVWCAGGLAAAGVVPGIADPSYSCGPRRGHAGERICIDAQPDYPPGGADLYRCRFEQEQGLSRECVKRARPEAMSSTLRERRPECWLDEDCDGARCVQGTCGGAS